MLEVKDLNIKTLSGRTLLKDVSFILNKGDKMAIIGEEGNDKTTLLKSIYNKDLLEDVFTVRGSIVTNNLSIGYLEQFLDAGWDDMTPMDYFLKENADSDINYDTYNDFGLIEKHLNRLNLKSKILESEQKIKTLSGGQKTKVFLTQLMISDSNILILDEPTRNLSPLSNPVIRSFLKNYKGAIISISHDRKYLSEVCDEVYNLSQEGLIDTSSK